MKQEMLTYEELGKLVSSKDRNYVIWYHPTRLSSIWAKLIVKDQ